MCRDFIDPPSAFLSPAARTKDRKAQTGCCDWNVSKAAKELLRIRQKRISIKELLHIRQKRISDQRTAAHPAEANKHQRTAAHSAEANKRSKKPGHIAAALNREHIKRSGTHTDKATPLRSSVRHIRSLKRSDIPRRLFASRQKRRNLSARVLGRAYGCFCTYRLSSPLFSFSTRAEQGPDGAYFVRRAMSWATCLRRLKGPVP